MLIRANQHRVLGARDLQGRSRHRHNQDQRHAGLDHAHDGHRAPRLPRPDRLLPKFVPHYGIIAKPLTQLLTKKGFAWNDKAQQAFKLLKQAMVSTPVLALPDFAKLFAIETDACGTGMGTMLTQDGHPVAYLNKALGVKNQKLSTYEKEFLAMMMAINKWRP